MDSNKIPGSERLTRPEEISALSKFLKEIKTTQEEHVDLGDSVLAVTGKSTGKFPNIELKKSKSGIPENKQSGISSLDNNIEKLKGTSEITDLYSSILGIDDNSVVKLSDKKENLERVQSNIILSDSINKLEGQKELLDLEKRVPEKLEDTRKLNISGVEKVSLSVKEKNKLEPEKVSLEINKKTVDLENVVQNLSALKDTETLSDTIESLYKESEISSLSGVEEKLNISEETKKLSEIKKDLVVAEKIDELGNSVLGFDKSEENLELKKEVLELNDTRETTLGELKKEVLENIHNLSDEDLYKYSLDLLTKEESLALDQKIATLISTYLSNYKEKTLTQEEKEEFEKQLVTALQIAKEDLVPDSENTVDIDTTFSSSSIVRTPSYKLPDWKLPTVNTSDLVGTVENYITYGDKINVNSYIRWTVEESLGLGNLPDYVSSNTKRVLLEEALAAAVWARQKLEKLTKANRDRLPGDEIQIPALSTLISGGAGELARNSITVLKRMFTNVTSISGVDISNPKNRPSKDGETSKVDKVSNRFEQSEINNGNIGFDYTDFSKGNTVEEVYLQGEGIKTTLEELCSRKVSTVSSVENLIEILRDSEYITSIGKFGSYGKSGREEDNHYNSYTLDGNAYWEIVLEPYVGILNGNFSYLPAFGEMDTINREQHGVYTYHGKWIPFTGFELQKSRMVSKTLGLYDGEIAYPVSSELTNELRITIADDSYKSWKHYFQKCMDVSVYSSEPHNAIFYSDSYRKDIKPTAVDKSVQLIAFYKNISFRIKIYVMTPQYSTIRKFDLLCVLREYSEDYVGEIDAGGSPDITLVFSIVGEDPGSEEKKYLVNRNKEEQRLTEQALLEERTKKLLEETKHCPTIVANIKSPELKTTIRNLVGIGIINEKGEKLATDYYDSNTDEFIYREYTVPENIPGVSKEVLSTLYANASKTATKNLLQQQDLEKSIVDSWKKKNDLI